MCRLPPKKIMKNLRFSDKIYSLCVCCMSYKTCLSRDWFGFRILICKNNVVQENFYEYFRTQICVLYIKQIFSIEERNNFKFVWGFFLHMAVFVHCAKHLNQVGRQSHRLPRTLWAAIVVQQLASQGRTHQVEHKSPLIRDSQVPLEWSAQQPITLLS